MTNIDYSKLLAISVLTALAIALAAPAVGIGGGGTVLQKSDRLPLAAQPDSGVGR